MAAAPSTAAHAVLGPEPAARSPSECPVQVPLWLGGRGSAAVPPEGGWELLVLGLPWGLGRLYRASCPRLCSSPEAGSRCLSFLFLGCFLFENRVGGGVSSVSELRVARVGPMTCPQAACWEGSWTALRACSCSAAKPVWGLHAVSVRLSPRVPSLMCPLEWAVPQGVGRPLRDSAPC